MSTVVGRHAAALTPTICSTAALPVAAKLSRQLALLARDFRSEIFRLVDLAELDHIVCAGRAALGPLDRLVARFHPDHPKTADRFSGLRNRAIRHLGLAAGERDAGASRRRREAVERQQYAGLL